jgi:O-antigen/teichoic acid export membrane protein
MTTRTILKNVGSNSLGYVVNVAVGIALSRFIRDSLGNAGTGIWSLVVSFVGYYGLLDVGIRSAVGHYVATYHSRREPLQVNRILGSALAMMLLVAAVAAAITIAAAFWLPSWIAHLNELRVASGEPPIELSGALDDPATLRAVVLVMGLGFAINFPMVLYGTVIYSLQRIGLQNAIGIGQVLLRAALTVWALRSGQGIRGLAAVVVGTNALAWVASIVAAYRVLPGLSLSVRHANRISSRELLSYGGFNVLVNVGDTVLLYTSGFVIFGALHDPVAITYYSIPANQLVPYFMSIVQAITWSFTPYFTARWATGASADVRRLLESGSRGVVAFAALIAGGLWFLGRDFLMVWQGESYFGSPNQAYFEQSAACLAILTGATLLRAAQSCGRQALFAMREVRYLGLLTLAEAVFNVLLSLLLVRRFGLRGIAIATLIPVVITQGFVQPRHLLRELECDARRFLLDLLRASVPIVATMALVDLALGARLAAISWPTFLLRGVALSLPALVVGLFCATSAGERRSIGRFLFAKAGEESGAPP